MLPSTPIGRQTTMSGLSGGLLLIAATMVDQPDRRRSRSSPVGAVRRERDRRASDASSGVGSGFAGAAAGGAAARPAGRGSRGRSVRLAARRGRGSRLGARRGGDGAAGSAAGAAVAGGRRRPRWRRGPRR